MEKAGGANLLAADWFADAIWQQVLDTVARRGQEMAAEMSRALPFPLIYRGTVKSAQDAVQLMKMANEDEACCGVMVWCHTFRPCENVDRGPAPSAKALLPLCHTV